MTLGFSFCPLWMVKPRGGATTKAVSDRVCLPRLRMSSDGDFSTERLLKKIERAGLSLDVSCRQQFPPVLSEFRQHALDTLSEMLARGR